MKYNDVILQTVTKFISFLIFLFAIYIFFNGHQEPGGGFAGGLMTSAALVLLLLAFDMDTIRRAMPIDYKTMIAIGLVFGVGTGVGSFFFSTPFLSQTFGYFHFPVLGELELTTTLAFDLGVYLTVVGATMTIIQTIGEDK
ncbi:Na(+)/H(+) antiporter subunit B [Marinococcus halophilus]|uniref:Na(+)/H(+) antiporter subunit B n=1 Tax=Marinococcus halophilus TaxID=1371 RepID=UPI0009A8B65F|nr:Na(+)/H(+) antiporter subunit B [Marinococcus halophilus]